MKTTIPDDLRKKRTAEIVKKAGGPGLVGRACNNITSQAVSLWVDIPVERVPIVAELAKMAPHRIRPDLPLVFKKPTKCPNCGYRK